MKFLTLLIVLSLFIAPQLFSQEPERLWTSKDGIETVTGRLQSQDDTIVTLITSNGTSRTVSKSLLSDADNEYLAQVTTAATQAQSGTSGEPGKVATALDGALIDEDGNSVELGFTGADTKFLFYYSASWCGPCRSFTPDLVRFAKRHDDNLQVILVPSDKSLDATAKYLKQYKMPWPAINKFDKKSPKVVPGNPTGYIPAMVMTDADGKKLLANSKKLSRDDFLDEAKDLLK